MRTRTKTALCIDWLRAREGGKTPPVDAPNDWGCPRGAYCEFAHGEEDLRGLEKEKVEEKKQQAYEDKKTKTKDSYMKPLYEGMKSDSAINDMVLQGLRQASKKSKLSKDKAVPTAALIDSSNEMVKTSSSTSSSTTITDSVPLSQPPAVLSREFVSLASGQIIVEKGVEEGIVVLTGNSKFASAILTFNKNSPGVWYFEIELLSDGLMQLGWIDDEFQDSANDKEGDGIGDDVNGHSWAFDGFRNKLLHKGEEIALLAASSSSSSAIGDKGIKEDKKERESWETNDVVGCLLRIDEVSSSSSSSNKKASNKRNEVHFIYFLNGNRVPGGEFQFIVESNHSGFYPAVSLEEGESIVVNNGEKVPFKFPPKEQFPSLLPLCSHTTS
jgi:hypothetical protein